MKVVRRKRDLRLSVSRRNEDIFVIWKAIQAADPNPSSTVIKWIRERYIKEWGNKTKVLSAPQQGPPTVIKSPPRQKTQDEIRIEKERMEAEAARQKEIERLKAEEIANIKKLMKKS